MCARVKVKFGSSPIRVERPMTLDYTILAVDLVVEMVRLDKHGLCFELPSTSRSSALALCCRRNGENAYLQMKDQRYSSLCLDHVRVLFWTNITSTNGLLNWTIQMWKICCICHVQCQIHGSVHCESWHGEIPPTLVSHLIQKKNLIKKTSVPSPDTWPT